MLPIWRKGNVIPPTQSVYSHRVAKTHLNYVVDTAGFRFVISTPTQTLDKDDRKVIRGHAVKARARHVRKTIQPPSWMNLNEDPSGKTTAMAVSQSKVALPRPVGWAFSGLHLAAGFEPHMVQELVQMISMNKYVGYPHEICLQVHPVDRGWFPYQLSDICCLHSLMFSLRAFTENDALSPQASYHHAQTLRILQARVDNFDRTSAISDATIMAVITLAAIAELMGDVISMEIHIDGLAKMVKLRGGIQSLDTFVNLPVKVCRADLSYALLSGHRPFVFQGEISWDCVIADRGLVKCSHGTHEHFIHTFAKTTLHSSRLHNILRDLHSFCCISNVAYQTTRKLAPELYNEMIISLMYRLMLLSFDDHDHDHILQETVRLGLLVFCSTIFMRRYFLEEEPYELLSDLYENSLSQLIGDSKIEIPVSVRLWLTILPFLATSKQPLPGGDRRKIWLDRSVVLAGAETWSAACDLLRSVSWIGFIHDGHGRRAFDAARSRIHLCP